MNPFSKLFRSRDKPQNHLGGLSFLFGQTAAVYTCVCILAESIACLPLVVYRRADVFFILRYCSAKNLVKSTKSAYLCCMNILIRYCKRLLVGGMRIHSKEWHTFLCLDI